ncbi:conserved hypothetical protein [Vibrio crassostreae]|uniref:hypothetical protein n=1 Tax=Vibrio TaxID=662 RepID=UPI0005E32C3C|nr:hypothetical protein [Vibrio crassostreae]CAK1712555.1 conserved hypothetical protein [Vibrio crassostreae]CAK1751672.1 conserved hypothetical protein [Vibrio crassostreae]CAK1753211.1 conserved hypothetical protein [Vibrio crassostreae]CAK1762304.1 conserved hypothetical protein [Vibrio crassostreae]CAK1773224.1 conserved hypothetical protein [Vibrio crassostreae]
MGNINRTEYHELNLLLWDMHIKFIAPKVALSVYEKRWAFVDQKKINPNERKLLDRLINEFGNGCFMPAI